MKELNEQVFINLFREACQKCFGYDLVAPLSETDSKVLATEIFQHTGLVIGVKSIKNYSQYIFNTGEGKKENPSAATLDTLARYVLNAPETDEIKRKKQESHHPYWFQYRNRFIHNSPQSKKPVGFRKIIVALLVALSVVIVYILIKNFPAKSDKTYFADEFNSVSADSLYANGWMVKNPESYYWEKKNSASGYLSLFTLFGDNWPDAGKKSFAGIKNLLVRKIDADCFTAEIHLLDFIPHQSWQQAGILLSEDSTFSGKALRLSIGYNNFFGGYTKPAEIIIQVVGSTVDGSISRPEEIAHVTLFSGEPLKDSLIMNNLTRSALKIEKKGNHFRFLYTNGRMEGFAFKEAAHGDFAIQPKYIGLFAMQGLAESQKIIPVQFDSFSLIGLDCNK